MARGHRVLITGVASYWGTELAKRLQRDPSVSWLAGLDRKPPTIEVDGMQFVEADIRDPELVRILPRLEVDTIVHCGIVWYPEPEEDKPAKALHEINVIGTIQLLAACELAPTLERLIVRGSAAIYGAEAGAPSFFTEEMSGRRDPATRFQRDIAELEGYFDTFAERFPQIVCCMLRYQPELGVDVRTPLNRYLSLPVVPMQLGFDPRLQFVHATDATGALLAATRNPVRGAVNVAPNGAISLSKLLRMAGRPALPVPNRLFAPAFTGVARQLGLADLDGDSVVLLRFGRGVDNTRLREEVGYEPRYDAVGAVREFLGSSPERRLLPLPGLADPRRLRMPV